MGSVFSPHYRRERLHRADADPLAHVALNAVLYDLEQGPRAWVMTEYDQRDLVQHPTHLGIGPTQIERDGESMVIALRERGLKRGAPFCGALRLWGEKESSFVATLDNAGAHRWHPIWARAQFTLELDEPRLSLRGTAYHDANEGDGSLEDAFVGWSWSHTRLCERTAVFYDVERRDGSTQQLALLINERGEVEPVAAPPRIALPTTPWRMHRHVRSGAAPRLVRTLLDSPFYARSLVETTLDETPALTMHEQLSLTRFVAPWMQWMLPFRMRRGRAER